MAEKKKFSLLRFVNNWLPTAIGLFFILFAIVGCVAIYCGEESKDITSGNKMFSCIVIVFVCLYCGANASGMSWQFGQRANRRLDRDGSPNLLPTDPAERKSFFIGIAVMFIGGGLAIAIGHYTKEPAHAWSCLVITIFLALFAGLYFALEKPKKKIQR
mgnify:CR=1 FL=1|tara:strand:+ start:387 stop:863 length:477 start_codon:yes stop_codon:yes gene_type:complete